MHNSITLFSSSCFHSHTFTLLLPSPLSPPLNARFYNSFSSSYLNSHTFTLLLPSPLSPPLNARFYNSFFSSYLNSHTFTLLLPSPLFLCLLLQMQDSITLFPLPVLILTHLHSYFPPLSFSLSSSKCTIL